MKTVLILAKHELKTAGRERLSQALLVIFVGMVLVSAAIGWTAHSTVMNVYNETLRETGRHLANPFAGASPLEPVKNTVIYIVLIGALLAIITGVRSSLRDRKAAVIDLLFSRPIKIRDYLAGKLLGIQGWLGVVLLAASALSWLSVWVVTGRALSAGDTAALLGFFALAWIFLLPFSALGLVAGAKTKHEANALLIPILFWVAVTFIVPQLGTAENPSALLNPVPARMASSGPLSSLNRVVLQPLSVTEHFKHISGVILRLPETGGGSIWFDLSVLLAAALIGLALPALITRAALRGPLYE
jgi:ABC-2 type transport system permease protein